MVDNSEERGFGEVAEREDGEENEGAENTAEETEEDEQIEDDQNESEEDDSDEADDQQDDEEDTEDDDEDDSQESGEKTDKGTNLDKNPKSAVHQQLANERQKASQYEKVLADPKLIQRFLKAQYGIDVALPDGKSTAEAGDGKTGKEESKPSVFSGKKYTADDFKNIEDVANVVNQMKEDFNSEIKARDDEIAGLKKQVGGINSQSNLARIADRTASDVASLREIAELNPKSEDFIPGLEEQIGALYHQLDFDESTGQYKGQYSIKQIGDYIINAARGARKTGSERAQTIVRNKTGGKVRTGNSRVNSDSTDNLSPGDSIAKGVARMFKN